MGGSVTQFDYVIVGAGPAGCVLANRLSADPACRVVLLEAGGPDRAREIRIPAAFTKLLQTGYDWSYRTTPQPRLAGARRVGDRRQRAVRAGHEHRLGRAVREPPLAQRG